MPSRLLKHARPDAELIDVGSASPQEMAQEAISYLLAEKAREGKLVARLKWGDPFVFDRGGEEALFLHEQRVPYEVVPGVPAGIAVPAYAGVPVTYPGGGDTVTLVRGYEDESRDAAGHRLGQPRAARRHGGLLRRRAAAAARARGAGRPTAGRPTKTAVIVYNGTLPTQETLTGTLAELLQRHRARTRAASRRCSSSATSSGSASTCAGSTRARSSAAACS